MKIGKYMIIGVFIFLILTTVVYAQVTFKTAFNPFTNQLDFYTTDLDNESAVTVTNITVLKNVFALNLSGNLSCEALFGGTDGDFCVDATAAGGFDFDTYFDQGVNKSSNTTFQNLTVDVIRSDDWTNATITESQIEDLVHTIDTIDGDWNVEDGILSNTSALVTVDQFNATNITVQNISANIYFGNNVSAALAWSNLFAYPSTCTSSQYISGLGDTLSCAAISITESQISDLTHTVDTTNQHWESDGNALFNLTATVVSINQLNATNGSFENISGDGVYFNNISGAMTWTDLYSYPIACTTSETITGIGDTITCTAISITESQISDLSHTTDTVNFHWRTEDGVLINLSASLVVINELNATNATFQNISGDFASFNNLSGSIDCLNIIGGTDTNFCDDADTGGGAADGDWLTGDNLLYNDTVGIHAGIGTATPETAWDVAGGYIRALADGTNNFPTTGTGIEMAYITASGLDSGYILSFDRDGSIYERLQIDANPLVLQNSSKADLYLYEVIVTQNQTIWGELNVSGNSTFQHNVTAETFRGGLDTGTIHITDDIDDEHIETDVNTYVDIAGDTMVGNLHLEDAWLNISNSTGGPSPSECQIWNNGTGICICSC